MVTVEEGLNWKNSMILRDERFSIYRVEQVCKNDHLFFTSLLEAVKECGLPCFGTTKCNVYLSDEG